MTTEPLSAEFFRRSPVECARELIGCQFTWRGCSGIVVETEAYLSEGDPACHTHFRPSARRFVEEREAGTAYVYLNYGVHWLFNLLVKGPEGSGFVLFRALHPLHGLARMKARRGRERAHELCSGPGKLTQALGIDGRTHGRAVLATRYCQIQPGTPEAPPLACPRIGISSARDRPWRFLCPQSPSISVRPPADSDATPSS